jgi:hypothetical protein
MNIKRVRRLYHLEGLQMRLKPPRRRVTAKLRCDRSDATGPNQIWAMDWMFGETFDGKRLWVLTVIDSGKLQHQTVQFPGSGHALILPPQGLPSCERV